MQPEAGLLPPVLRPLPPQLLAGDDTPAPGVAAGLRRAAGAVGDVVGNVLIPPYTRKYLLQPRDDLHALEPILPD